MFQKNKYHLRRKNAGSRRKSRTKRLLKDKLPELLLYTSYLHVNVYIADETGCGGDNGEIPMTPTSTNTEICMDNSQMHSRPVSISSNGDARTGTADLGDNTTIPNHHHQLQNHSSLVSQNDATINTSVSSSAPQTPNAGDNF